MGLTVGAQAGLRIQPCSTFFTEIFHANFLLTNFFHHGSQTDGLVRPAYLCPFFLPACIAGAAESVQSPPLCSTAVAYSQILVISR